MSGLESNLCGLQLNAHIIHKNIIHPADINRQLYVCIYIVIEPLSVVLGPLPQWSSITATE